MNLEEYKDEYGYIVDEDHFINSDYYKNLSDDEKKTLLIAIIGNNADNLKKKQSIFINIKIDEDRTECSKHISDMKGWKLPNIEALLHYDNCDDMVRDGLLPKRDSALFDKKIKTLILAVRNELEEYETIKYEDNEGCFKEQREAYQRLLDLLIDYNTYEDEDIQIDVQSDFSVFYMPDNLDFESESNLSPLIKDISKNSKQDVLLTMIDSIKQQEFKGLKRFTKPFSDFYELRNGQQRVIFNFLTPNIAVIVFALTKKVNSDKRYRGELYSRTSKYRRMKSQLKKAISNSFNNSFLEQQIKIDNIIYKGNTYEKTLIKERDEDE